MKYLSHKQLYDKKRYTILRDSIKLRTRKYTKNNPEKQAVYQAFQRCHNPNSKAFKYYGARGIKCLFQSGQELIDCIGKRPGCGYSLDRINNDGHYEPGNIRWATKSQQYWNSRTRFIPRSLITGRFI